MQEIIKKTERELLIRNYSRKTIKVYLYYIKEYSIFVSHKKYSNKEEAIKSYLFKKKNKVSIPINTILF